MKIIETDLLLPGYKACTIGPIIFLKRGMTMNEVDLNHEMIHWEQEKELLIIGFYILYLIEFFCNLLWFWNWHMAYRAIRFEQEAYNNEQDLSYIQLRKKFAWHEI